MKIQKPKHKTVGQASQEAAAQKVPEKKLQPYVDAMAAEEFIPNLLEAVKRGKQLFTGDFYINNAGKNEQILTNVLRSYWIPLIACPTPNFDQCLFKYHAKDEQITLIWTIPTEAGCEYLVRNRLYVVPEEQDLLGYTIAFIDGSLEKMAKFLNGEKDSDPSIILEVMN